MRRLKTAALASSLLLLAGLCPLSSQHSATSDPPFTGDMLVDNTETSVAVQCAQQQALLPGRGGRGGRGDIPLSANCVSASASISTQDDAQRHITYTIHVARDSQGRVRYERGTEVLIDDDSAKTELVLDMESHKAQLRVSVTGFDTIAGFRLPLLKAPPLGAIQVTADSGLVALPDSTIDGVLAHGTRIDHVFKYAANQRDFTVVREEWRAADSGMLLLITVDDPRIGQSKISFKNVKLGEPLASLFAVPDGFKTTTAGLEFADRRRLMDEAADAVAHSPALAKPGLYLAFALQQMGNRPSDPPSTDDSACDDTCQAIASSYLRSFQSALDLSLAPDGSNLSDQDTATDRALRQSIKEQYEPQALMSYWRLFIRHPDERDQATDRVVAEIQKADVHHALFYDRWLPAIMQSQSNRPEPLLLITESLNADGSFPYLGVATVLGLQRSPAADPAAAIQTSLLAGELGTVLAKGITVMALDKRSLDAIVQIAYQAVVQCDKDGFERSPMLLKAAHAADPDLDSGLKTAITQLLTGVPALAGYVQQFPATAHQLLVLLESFEPTAAKQLNLQLPAPAAPTFGAGPARNAMADLQRMSLTNPEAAIQDIGSLNSPADQLKLLSNWANRFANTNPAASSQAADAALALAPSLLPSSPTDFDTPPDRPGEAPIDRFPQTIMDLASVALALEEQGRHDDAEAALSRTLAASNSWVRDYVNYMDSAPPLLQDEDDAAYGHVSVGNTIYARAALIDRDAAVGFAESLPPALRAVALASIARASADVAAARLPTLR